MGGGEPVRLRVGAADDEDVGEVAALAQRLRAELLDLDVAAVDPVPAEADADERAKGFGAMAGDLLVWLGPAGLGAALAKVAGWAARGGRVVEVTIGGESLKLGMASREQQDRLVEAFVARHSPSP